jgi:transposase
MDNASFHRDERIEQMCREAGVQLLYLLPYSPDLNPIDFFHAELKGFIKKQWHKYENRPQQDFGAFLEWCVDMVRLVIEDRSGRSLGQSEW